MWLAIFAMASVKASTMLLPLVCDHCSVPGGDVVDVHRQAKEFIRHCKAGGLALPAIVAATRQHGCSYLRRAVLLRLADRLSGRNPLKLALQTEARCQ